MTDLEHLLHTRDWAKGWLSKSDADLPGTLTREKLFNELDRVEDALLDHMRLHPGQNGAPDRWSYDA